MNNQLTNDDIETICIHLNAFKETLCNQRRWKEAEEYQRIIDRFKEFASAQPNHLQGKWNVYVHMFNEFSYSCNYCGYSAPYQKSGGKIMQKKWRYCPNCGAMMVNAEE